jgi:hypothetical protein
MSVGTLADKASKNHINNIMRQKKVVFGERPSEISSSAYKSTENLEIDRNAKSLVEGQMNETVKGGIQTKGGELQNGVSMSEQHQQKAPKKNSDKPWYIINSENNDFLNLFKIVVPILAVPSVIFNLFL